ncbi:MAG TPA: PAS domain-containing protein, partial [Rhizobiales bacterium]|nr:PAS domain-containing protein [Hyphomicrobiales bacterium]
MWLKKLHTAAPVPPGKNSPCPPNSVIYRPAEKANRRTIHSSVAELTHCRSRCTTMKLAIRTTTICGTLNIGWRTCPPPNWPSESFSVKFHPFLRSWHGACSSSGTTYSNDTHTQKRHHMEFIYDDPPKIKVPSDIMHPSSRILFRFWEATRGEMAAARKQDLNLRQIAKILPNIAILERELAKPNYKWRLAGTGVCRLWGKELTGQDVLANWPGFERQTMQSGFDMVVASLQPCVARFKAINNLGSQIGVEFIGFPIQDANTGAIQILAAIVPFRSPDWLGTEELLTFEISSMRKIWTESLPGDSLGTSHAPNSSQKN